MKKIVLAFIFLVPILTYNQIINIPFDYPTIQQGIDAASDGDTVLVQAGVYVENINFNGKNIVVASLMLTTGDDTYISQTVIDGNQNGSVVTIDNGVNSTATLNGFTIQNGSGFGSGGQTHGGGIFLDGGVNPNLLNLIVKDNVAASCNGAGICCWGNNDCLIENVTVMGNDGRGTAMTNDGSGGILLANSSPVLRNVTIVNNKGLIAGGLFCSGNSNPVLINVTIANNIAYPSLNNNKTAEFFCWNNTKPLLVNTIIWSDSLPSIVLTVDTITISHSNIKGGIVFNGNGTVNWLGGNINSDPMFLDPQNENFSLADVSPCIDAGIQDVILVYNNGSDTFFVPPMNYFGTAPDMGSHEWYSSMIIDPLLQDHGLIVSIYPNPGSGVMHLQYQISDTRNLKFEFYSIAGVLLKTLNTGIQQPGRHEMEFDVSDLPDGLYFLRMQVGNYYVTEKVVVMH